MQLYTKYIFTIKRKFFKKNSWKTNFSDKKSLKKLGLFITRIIMYLFMFSWTKVGFEDKQETQLVLTRSLAKEILLGRIRVKDRVIVESSRHRCLN